MLKDWAEIDDREPNDWTGPIDDGTDMIERPEEPEPEPWKRVVLDDLEDGDYSCTPDRPHLDGDDWPVDVWECQGPSCVEDAKVGGFTGIGWSIVERETQYGSVEGAEWRAFWKVDGLALCEDCEAEVSYE